MSVDPKLPKSAAALETDISSNEILAEYTPQPDKIILHTFEEVEQLFYGYIKDELDRKKIHSAYEFAEKAHAGQFRKSGEAYIHHLIEVAYILSQLQAGPSTIIAGLLHDVVEDTAIGIDEIKKNFGSDVAMLMLPLTSRHHYQNSF